VGGACFQRHQVAAVFNASFSVFQIMYENSRINRKGLLRRYAYISMKCHENGTFVEGENKVAWLDLRTLRISPNPTSMES
jgi:hypothetical protein